MLNGLRTYLREKPNLDMLCVNPDGLERRLGRAAPELAADYGLTTEQVPDAVRAAVLVTCEFSESSAEKQAEMEASPSDSMPSTAAPTSDPYATYLADARSTFVDGGSLDGVVSTIPSNAALTVVAVLACRAYQENWPLAGAGSFGRQAPDLLMAGGLTENEARTAATYLGASAMGTCQDGEGW